MKKLTVLALLVSVLLVAKSEAGVLNHLDSWEDALKSSEVKNSALYGFRSHQLMEGIDVSVIGVNKDSLGLGSLRVGGVFTENMPYLMLDVETPNVLKSYIPEKVRNINLSIGAVDLIPSVGLWGGYKMKNDERMYDL